MLLNIFYDLSFSFWGRVFYFIIPYFDLWIHSMLQTVQDNAVATDEFPRSIDL